MKRKYYGKDHFHEDGHKRPKTALLTDIIEQEYEEELDEFLHYSTPRGIRTKSVRVRKKL